ncbi:uncharacterized protein [Symphalangus syndactylus]|uniref:uncharacterized protein n=1 Tax=Symphalangus syndactylus TaxID=9590 RepID=UPI003004AC1D
MSAPRTATPARRRSAAGEEGASRTHGSYPLTEREPSGVLRAPAAVTLSPVHSPDSAAAFCPFPGCCLPHLTRPRPTSCSLAPRDPPPPIHQTGRQPGGPQEQLEPLQASITGTSRKERVQLEDTESTPVPAGEKRREGPGGVLASSPALGKGEPWRHLLASLAKEAAAHSTGRELRPQNSKCQGPGAGASLACRGNRKKPVSLELYKQEGGSEGSSAPDCRSDLGICSCWRTAASRSGGLTLRLQGRSTSHNPSPRRTSLVALHSLGTASRGRHLSHSEARVAPAQDRYQEEAPAGRGCLACCLALRRPIPRAQQSQGLSQQDLQAQTSVWRRTISSSPSLLDLPTPGVAQEPRGALPGNQPKLPEVKGLVPLHCGVGNAAV